MGKKFGSVGKVTHRHSRDGRPGSRKKRSSSRFTVCRQIRRKEEKVLSYPRLLINAFYAIFSSLYPRIIQDP